MINVRTVKKTNIDQSTQDSIKTVHKNIPSAEINKENTEQKKTKVPERIDIKIDLIKICEAISENTKDFKEIVVSDDDLPYQIICGVPSVETIQRSLSTDDIENEDIITKLLKFVTEIKLINQKTGEAKSIVFNDFSIDEAKQLVEQIPNKLLVKATTKIVDIFNLLTTIQLYKFKLGNVEYYQALNFMNLDFFTSF